MRIEDIPGWYDDAFRDFYARFAAEGRDRPIAIEVGVWQGCSAIDLALKLAPTGTVYAVDAFDGRGGTPEMLAEVAAAGGSLLPRFLRNVVELGADGVVPVPFDSLRAADIFPYQCADLVFIDASHDALSVAADVRAWLPKVKPGGWLAGHDANYEGVQKGLAMAGLRGYYVERTVWSFRKEAS